MSVSACGLKTNIQSSLAPNKPNSNTFSFPNTNTHLSCTSPTSTYPSYPGVDSTDPNIYDIETHFQTNNHEQQQQQSQQQQQPRDSLPSPHLLLHSTNSSTSRPNRNSNPYSQNINYSLTSRDQAMDIKSPVYSGYPHYSRPNYDYNRPTISSPCYESLHEPNTFSHDRSHYQSIQDGSSFPNWPMSSLIHPIKTEPRADYVTNTDSQHVSCTEDFPIHTPMRGHDNGGLFSDRSSGSKHFNNSDLLDNAIHSNGHSIETTNNTNFHPANVAPLNQDSSSGSVVLAAAACRTNMSSQRDRIPNQTKLGTKPVGRPSRVASTTSQPLSIGATSPLGSTTTMTPDSSTTGFTGNRFTCSSDDGEASPAPTCSSGCPQTPGRSRKPAPTLATGRRNLKGELVDPDEADRRMKRRERNRKSAQKCRERKVQRTHELQSQVDYLQVEASRLMQELEGWRTQARQCVALLQHHCPGVAIPYLSCLNEFPPNFKDSVDSLMDILPSDNGTTYINPPGSTLNWKSKPATKPFSQANSDLAAHGTRFASQNASMASNDSTSILPSMNMIHSQTAPNRSKSLFGFSTPNTSHEKDSSITECLIPSECDTSHSGLEREDPNPIIRSNSSVSIRGVSAGTASVAGGAASTGVTSIGGPASASSSSSCSTYELSLPMVESSLSNLTENGLFKEFNEPNQSRVRMLSGHESLPSITNGNNTIDGTTSSSNNKPSETWNSQRYDDYCTKSMHLNTSKHQRMFPNSFDSELTVRCDSQALSSSNRSASSMEGACYT